ncbi:hypothetical protein ACHAWF_016552 [Thalassiosira exigua]
MSFGTGMGYGLSSIAAEAAPYMTHDVMAHLEPKNNVHELPSSFPELSCPSTSLPASKSSKFVVLVWHSLV